MEENGGTYEYVYIHRDGQDTVEAQHPSFTGRVCLQDREMHEGNLSITLKNATIGDGGLYECYVLTLRTKRNKRFAQQMKCSSESLSRRSHSKGKRHGTRPPADRMDFWCSGCTRVSMCCWMGDTPQKRTTSSSAD